MTLNESRIFEALLSPGGGYQDQTTPCLVTGLGGIRAGLRREKGGGKTHGRNKNGRTTRALTKNSRRTPVIKRRRGE
jgi:hypothetical protein